MNIKLSIEELKQKIESIKTELKNKIQSLPDNSKISRLSSGAFTISSKDIFTSKGTNLSPSYYDFKYQYSYLCDLIDKTEVNKILDRLNNVVDMGTHREGINTMHFNPEVIAYLKEIIA